MTSIEKEGMNKDIWHEGIIDELFINMNDCDQNPQGLLDCIAYSVPWPGMYVTCLPALGALL